MKHESRFSTAAHAARMGLPTEASIAVLGRDPRVQQAYVQWCLDHQLLGILDDATFRARLRRAAGDLERLQRLVHDDLKLSYRWLPQELLRDFGLTIISEATTGDMTSAQYEPVTDGLPRGRRPKHDGEHIARDVEWFYRTKIKVPPDSVSAIAKEYVQREGGHRSGDGRSVIRPAIRHAEQLLNSLDLEDPTFLPK